MMSATQMSISSEDSDSSDYETDFIGSAIQKTKTALSSGSCLPCVNVHKIEKDLSDLKNAKAKAKRDNQLKTDKENNQGDVEAPPPSGNISLNVTPPASPSATPTNVEEEETRPRRRGSKIGRRQISIRGGKRTRKTEQALKKISKVQNQNTVALSSDEEEEDYEMIVDKNRTFELKIQWRFDVHRIPVHKDETVSTVLERFSAIVGERECDLQLFSGSRTQDDEDSELPVAKGTTMGAAGLGLTSVVEVRKLQGLENSMEGRQREPEEAPPKTGLTIKVQCKDRRHNKDIELEPGQKMSVLFAKYSLLKEIALDRLGFYLDGERIGDDETPEDLDLEDGDCIDVHVKEEEEKKKTEEKGEKKEQKQPAKRGRGRGRGRRR